MRLRLDADNISRWVTLYAHLAVIGIVSHPTRYQALTSGGQRRLVSKAHRKLLSIAALESCAVSHPLHEAL
jgi:hypothetical protein